jgi:hypothetical protein
MIMRKNRIILGLGVVIVFLSLYGGFPLFWENILYTILGLMIAFLSFMADRERTPQRSSKPKVPTMNDVFVENKSRKPRKGKITLQQ